MFFGIHTSAGDVLVLVSFVSKDQADLDCDDPEGEKRRRGLFLDMPSPKKVQGEGMKRRL